MQTAELNESPTAWFALLERAKRTGNVELALRAAGNLRRLGVQVEFRLPPLAVKAEGADDGK